MPSTNQMRASLNIRHRRWWRVATLLLMLATTLSACQVGATIPTPIPTPPAAATVSPAVAATATQAATATHTTSPPPAAAVTRAATAERISPPASRGTATRPSASTPSAQASPITGAVCVFTPPFARDFAVSATPTIAPGARPAGAPAPAQTPPTIPLPNLTASYTLNVDQFDFAEGRLRTAQTVRVTNRERCALDRLYFSVTAARWGWFALSGVQVAGQPVAATLNGTVLPLRLPQPLAAGATTEITIDFRLDVGVAVDQYTPGGFAGTTQTGDILRLAYWFPILSDDHQYPPYLDPPYTATADYTMTITTPAEIIIAPNGTITGEQMNGDGTITRRIEARNVRDFALGLSPNYQVARRQSANGVLVEVYYSPQSFGRNAQNPAFVQQLVTKALDAAVLAEERLSALIGPYPYPALRVVDGGATLSGGIEFPTVIMVNLNYGSDDLIYHEVGHEWIYGLLGTRNQQDPWIDEGGATFLANYLNNTLPANPAAPDTFAYRLSTPVWAIPPGGGQRGATEAIYTQGGDFYTRVMQTMGEDAFWQAMQQLYREHRYAIITPHDILGIWQAHSPTDLRPLFKEYLDYPWLDQLTR